MFKTNMAHQQNKVPIIKISRTILVKSKVQDKTTPLELEMEGKAPALGEKSNPIKIPAPNARKTVEKETKLKTTALGKEKPDSRLNQVEIQQEEAKEAEEAKEDEEGEEAKEIDWTHANPWLKIKAVKDFGEKVTWAGLVEAFESVTIIERQWWWFVLTVAFMLMIAHCVVTGLKYGQNEAIVMNDMDIVNKQVPFPNITFCGPKHQNETKVREGLFFSKQVRDIMKKVHVNEDQVIEFISKTALSLTDLANAALKPDLAKVRFVAEKVVDATVQLRKKPRWELGLSGALPCQEILSNCSFEGQPFNCCAAAQFYFVEHGHCYQIQSTTYVPNVTATSDGSSHANSVEKGLSIKVSADYSIANYYDDVALGGFYVHVGELPWLLSDPVAIPIGMDAVIVLAPPKKLLQREDCTQNDKAPNYQYSRFYDSDGYYCVANGLNWLTSINANCTMPMLDYLPPYDEECKTRLIWSFLTFLSAFAGDGGVIKGGISLQDSQRLKILANKNCMPLCNRWRYGITSVSYGAVQYGNPLQNANRTWSRFRVFFPTTTYRRHEEQVTYLVYMAVCDVGGLMGVYTGVSAITFIQLLFYGVIACIAVKNPPAATEFTDNTDNGPSTSTVRSAPAPAEFTDNTVNGPSTSTAV